MLVVFFKLVSLTPGSRRRTAAEHVCSERKCEMLALSAVKPSGVFRGA